MKKDLYLSFIFFFTLILGAYYLSTFREINLGGEYRCIAEALLRGDGFSDPFCANEGVSIRTAWMPPFLSYVQAGIFALFGLDSAISTFLLLAISNAALALTLFFMLRLANECNSTYRHVCILLFSGYLIMNPGPFILSFHDVWLIAVASMAIPYVLYFHFIKRTLGVSPVILLAVLLPLISPVLSLSFVCIVAWLFLKEYYRYWKNNKEVRGLLNHKTRSIPKLLLIAAAFLLPVLLWGSRNYLTFDKFIPVKSNLWFDFYQANVYDEDGLVTGFTFANFHPIKNKARLREYQQTGETRLMEEYKERSVTYLKENPSDYFSKVGNRMYSTFVYARHPYDEDFKIDEETLTASDIALLKDKRIVSASNSLNMQIGPETFKTKISSLELNNQSQIVTEWQQAKAQYDREYSSPLRTLESSLISGIPFLAWLISLLLIRRSDHEKELFTILSVLYLSYLLPYAMISVHTRYQIPLSALFSLLMYFAFILSLKRIKPSLVKKRKVSYPSKMIKI